MRIAILFRAGRSKVYIRDKRVWEQKNVKNCFPFSGLYDNIYPVIGGRFILYWYSIQTPISRQDDTSSRRNMRHSSLSRPVTVYSDSRTRTEIDHLVQQPNITHTIREKNLVRVWVIPGRIENTVRGKNRRASRGPGRK